MLVDHCCISFGWLAFRFALMRFRHRTAGAELIPTQTNSIPTMHVTVWEVLLRDYAP